MTIIKQAELSDLKDLMLYIDENSARKNHILSRNKKVMKWLYFDKIKKKYNFLIAKQNKKIIGIIGFIKNSHFQKISLNKIVWFSPWFSSKNKSDNFSGIEFIHKLLIKNKSCIIGTTACNSTTKNILDILGFKIGHLNHFYLINHSLDKYHICSIRKNHKKFKAKISKLKINKESYLNFKSTRDSKFRLQKMYFKDLAYFENKYSKNPFYKYFYLKIKKDNKDCAFFVARECFYKKSKILRLVDYYGDINCLDKIGYQMNDFITQYRYEYVDFYNHGIDKQKLFLSGFQLSEENKDIIIPNYFEPFIKKNIRLNFAFYPKKRVNLIFKGDCDQERPNF